MSIDKAKFLSIEKFYFNSNGFKNFKINIRLNAINDYRKVIELAESQFWPEYHVWKVHDDYLSMFIAKNERISKIHENKRSDLDNFRFPHLPSWINNQAKEWNSAMHRFIFIHNTIQDLEKIMKENLSKISSK
ncbi:hypothetical protein M9Y10_012363 [Tritrichomonas musculus]|uniref:Cytoplasmic protein n=1 Tax=Tritrichomonas musculus TaxID=1915356 RepID=A0ABR2GN37_9EUKA